MAPENDTSDGRARDGAEAAEEVDGAVDGVVVLDAVDLGDGRGEEGVVPAGEDAVEDDEGEEARAGGVVPEREDR